MSFVNPLFKSLVVAQHFTDTAWTLRKLLAAIKRKADNDEIASIYQGWSRRVFEKMGYKIEVSGEKPLTEPCLYVGNHFSFLDIPLVWATTRGVFISKKEVRDWPLIGKAAEALGTTFVDRSSLSSRAKVLENIHEEILTQKKCVCIFPEGTSSVDGKPWRWGVFRAAQEHNIPVQPFRIIYKPLRDSAYIDEDTLPDQWWKIMNADNKLASIHWGSPRKITDFRADCESVRLWVRDSFDKKRAEIEAP